MNQLLRRGFTLLELAIVMVIIGLMIGGVMFARTLVSTAELQRVVTEYSLYKSAFHEFQTQYQALPGDFDKAEITWDANSGGICAGTTAVTAVPANTLTCNGDADGRVGTSSVDGTISNPDLEWWLVWQHLSNAGFIEGRFTGANASASAFTTDSAGVNLPSSSYSSGTWKIFYYANNANHTTDSALRPAMWADSYGHILSLGSGSSSNSHATPVLSPLNAWEIDNKIDDGAPGQGSVRTWRNALSTNSNCNDNDAGGQRGVTYNADFTTVGCSLLFILD